MRKRVVEPQAGRAGSKPVSHPPPQGAAPTFAPQSPDDLLHMQATAGNAASVQLMAARALPGEPGVQRTADRPVVQRKAPPTPREAWESGDADQVADVPDAAWANAGNQDRRNAVLVMIRKKVMFPWNGTTVVKILNSYPSRESMTAVDIDVVRQAVDAPWVDASDLRGYSALVREFEQTVVERARQNVSKNLEELDEMAKKYGIGREAEGGASGIPSAMDELQMAAGRVADARRVQLELRKVQVGWEPIDPNAPFLPSNRPVRFHPDKRPIDFASSGGGAQNQEAAGIFPWWKVNTAWEQVELQIAKTLAANPALYLLAASPALDQRLMTDDDRLQFGRSALSGFETTPPDQAKKELAAAHQRAKDALLKVRAEIGEPKDPIDRSKVDVGSLDEVGLRVSESPRFDSPFARWSTRHWLDKEQTRKARIASIIDFGTAAILVGATVATMGGAAAAAAILAGGAAAGAIASAGVRISNAADLQTKSEAGFTPETKLTSDAKVLSAELDAAIAVATAILSVVAAAKGIKGLAGLFKTSSVAEDLARLRSLSERRAREVVQKSIQESGVLATSQQAGFGNDVYQLHKYLPQGSAEAAQVLEVAELIGKGLVAGAEGALWRPELSGARKRATIADLKHWVKSGRRLYTHRTSQLEVVMNDVVKPYELPPHLRPNPTAPQGVYFFGGLEGKNYGPFCFVVDEAELRGAVEIKPGEYISTRHFGTDVGHWFHIDDLHTARGRQ